MNPNPSAPLSTTDDLELGAILHTLWKNRWKILLPSLLSALAMYAVSAWVLPKQYQAAAYVAIGQSRVDTTFVPSLPEGTTLQELISANFLLEEVKKDARITASIPKDAAFPEVEVRAVSVQTSKTITLRIQATGDDPQGVALAATVWAEKLIEWVDQTYGWKGMAAGLDKQIQAAQQAYAEAQTNLETSLAQNRLPALEDTLEAKREFYICLEKQITGINILLKRLTDLGERMSGDNVSPADAAFLRSIQEEAEALSACVTAQTLRLTTLSAPLENPTAAEARQSVSDLRAYLEDRMKTAQQEQIALQDDILALQTEVERLTYQQNELVIQRDEAKALYETLIAGRVAAESAVQGQASVGKIITPAAPPQRPSSPRPAVNAALTAMIAITVSSLLVLLRAHWGKPA